MSQFVSEKKSLESLNLNVLSLQTILGPPDIDQSLLNTSFGSYGLSFKLFGMVQRFFHRIWINFTFNK